MFDRRTLCLSLANALLVSPALVSFAWAADDDPAVPIAAIYERASGGGRGGQFVWLKRADRARWLSRDLARQWNKAAAKTAKGDQAPPGFDPVSNSQDGGVRAPKVTVRRRDTGSALVSVSFVGWGEAPKRQTVLYDMVWQGSVLGKKHWAIDDIRGTIDGKDWSIRQIVTNWKG